MTNSSDDWIDYARALEEAVAYLSARPNGADQARSRWGLWAALRPSDDLRYPVPELDPAKR